MDGIEKLNREIENVRNELHRLIDFEDIPFNHEVQNISVKLDKLINQYYELKVTE